jgi:hypothetical protein
MRRRFLTVAGLWLVPIVGLVMAHGSEPKTGGPEKSPKPLSELIDKQGEATSCGKHGTTVAFEDSPAEAAKKAKTEEKLVMVLHVSGLFEDPKLT